MREIGAAILRLQVLRAYPLNNNWQEQTLSHDSDQHHHGGNEDNVVPHRERPAVIQHSRQPDGNGQRYDATHAGLADDEAFLDAE
jgi:hypothetical protein